MESLSWTKASPHDFYRRNYSTPRGWLVVEDELERFQRMDPGSRHEEHAFKDKELEPAVPESIERKGSSRKLMWSAKI